MMTIEVRPSRKFKGAWVAFEAPGVEPTFPGPNGKQNAIDYARGRFGGSRGEIHVYCDDASTIERSIVIDGRGQYPQGGCVSKDLSVGQKIFEFLRNFASRFP